MTPVVDRVLMVGSWEYSGSGKAMAYYAEALSACGYTVEIMSFSRPHECIVNPRRFHSVTTHCVNNLALPFDGSPHIGHSISLINDIVEWIEEHASERIVLWGHYLYPYAIACMVATLISPWDTELHSCLVTPAGSDVWDEKQRRPELLRNLFVKRVEAVVPVYSSLFRDAVLDAYPFIQKCTINPPVLPDKHFCLPTSGEQAQAREQYGLSPDEPVLGVVCNMRPSKNIQLLGNALNILGLQDLSPTVMLIGPDKGKNVEGYCTIRTGLVDDVRVPIWACDCTINISAYDSFNLALLESMLCGVPAFTNMNSGITKSMSEWESQVVFSEQDAATLDRTGRVLVKTMSCQKYREELALKLRERAVIEYGLSKNMNRIHGEFSKLIGAR